MSFTSLSTCSWLDHLVSGLTHVTFYLLRFALATPTFTNLSLLDKLSRWPIMQKVHCYFTKKASIVCKQSVSEFTLLITNVIIPLRYCFTIGY